jgi:hypothetical protein
MAPATDLAVVIVAFNSRGWLEPCLSTLLGAADGLALDVVVVDNGSTDGSAELVEERFPEVTVLRAENRGFAAGNNAGLREVRDAPFVLLLNPDTEVREGTLADAVTALRARPEVGVLGVRQVLADGTLWPTIRRFPTVRRALGQALASESWPSRPRWAGERELDLSLYSGPVACDWMSGSFLLLRREALDAAGFLDERFFLFAEETDLCLRVRRAGWGVLHAPAMTIVHHADKGGVRPRMLAQDAYARGQYARKHFTPMRARAYVAALALGHALRAAAPAKPGSTRRAAARLALSTLLGRTPPPFGAPPATAVAPGAASDERPAAAIR